MLFLQTIAIWNSDHISEYVFQITIVQPSFKTSFIYKLINLNESQFKKFMKIQWPKNKIQDPLSKKKRKDKVMWYEREWKKKKNRSP